MEEKERYEVMSPSLNGYAYIHDFKTDNVLNTYDSCDLLNQQSKRIKELEKENQQLKQSQKQLAIDELEKVKNYMITDEKDMFGANYLMNSVYVLEFIDNQINELKEEIKNE